MTMKRTNMILSQHLSSVSYALKHLWRLSAEVEVADEEGEGEVDKDEVAKRLEATMPHLRMPDTLLLLSTAPDSLCTERPVTRCPRMQLVTILLQP